MALHTDTRIYKATYNLTCLVTQYVKNMPRDFKGDFGRDLRHDCMKLVKRIYEANTSEDKVRPLRRMRQKLAVVELSLRLAMDLRLISKAQYGAAIEITNDVGKQATGWLKHSESAPGATPSRRTGQRAS